MERSNEEKLLNQSFVAKTDLQDSIA